MASNEAKAPSQKAKASAFLIVFMLILTHNMSVLAPSRPVQAVAPVVDAFMSEYKGIPPEMTAKEYGRRVYMLQHGASKREWHCLRQLWTEESHWNYKAKNPNGGAYGIPQAKPAKKMAVSGSDWKTNPATQIKWGMKYLKSRYNFSACSALKHKHRRGWY